MIVPKEGRPVAAVYSPKEYQRWQQEAARALRAVVPHHFEGPVMVELIFEVAKPKTTRLPHPKPDLDNYEKAILDVLTRDGRFWNDDSQVAALCSLKRWATGAPGIHVTISTL